MTTTITRSIAPLVLPRTGTAALVACKTSPDTAPSPAEAGTATAQQALDRLVKLAGQRMMTADAVAAAKWGSLRPIDDPAREKAVIDTATSQGAKLGIAPDTVRRIFEDQIAANKTVQRALHATWKADPDKRPTHRPDLTTQVRPVLDRIDSDLLTAIRHAKSLMEDPRCGAALERAKTVTTEELGLDAAHRTGLDQALAHLCATPAR